MRGSGVKLLVGVWGQRPQKLKAFSVCHHNKTAFWSMKIRYLQVSELYIRPGIILGHSPNCTENVILVLKKIRYLQKSVII